MELAEVELEDVKERLAIAEVELEVYKESEGLYHFCPHNPIALKYVQNSHKMRMVPPMSRRILSPTSNKRNRTNVSRHLPVIYTPVASALGGRDHAMCGACQISIYMPLNQSARGCDLMRTRSTNLFMRRLAAG